MRAVAGDAFGRAVEGDDRHAEAAADRRVAEHPAVARPNGGDDRRRSPPASPRSGLRAPRPACRPSRSITPGDGPPPRGRGARRERERDECECDQPEHVRPPSTVSPPLHRERARGSRDLRGRARPYSGHGPTRVPRSRRCAAPARRGSARVCPAVGRTAARARHRRPRVEHRRVDLPTGRIVRRLAHARRPAQHRVRSAAPARSSPTRAPAGCRSSTRACASTRSEARSGRRATPPSRDDLRFAYVTDSGRQEVAVVDLRARRVVGRVPVGGPARHLALDVLGRRLWVALGSKAPRSRSSASTDPRAAAGVERVRPPFLAHDVGFEPGGRARLGHLRRPRPHRDLRRTTPAPRADAPRRRAAAARHLPRRSRVRDERRRRPPARACARRPPAPLSASAGRVVQRPARLRDDLHAVALAGDALHVQRAGAPLERVRVARSSHDACFVMAA